MATSTKNSFNYYSNGKFGTLPQKDMEITQDMHIKMSKKIAQLTKVIYALNTKNDEHEAILQSIKDQHEEEMQQLLAETKEKIERYTNKISNDLDYKRQLQILERSINDHEKERKAALSRFETFKREAEEREINLKTEHSQRILVLSKDVLTVKKDFETKLQEFDALKVRYDHDKRQALQAMHEEHKSEIDALISMYESKQGDTESIRSQLETKYSSELQSIQARCEQLELDKRSLGEEYENKLGKAQAFYENELQAFKNSHNSSYEQKVDSLTQERDKLQKDLSFQESQFKKRVDDLLNQLSVSEESVERYKKQLLALESSLKNKEGDSSMLSKQLSEAREDTSRTLAKLRDVELELAATKERCQSQADQLLKKSALQGELEATVLQHQSTIRDLRSELAKLKDRLSGLEQERNNLEGQSEASLHQQSQKLRALERALEDISVEKQTLKERLEREIATLQEKSEKREQELQNDHEVALSDLHKQHQSALDLQTRLSEDRLISIKNELTSRLDEERHRLIEERETLRREYFGVRDDLSSKLQSSESEVQRLEKIIADHEAGLGSATASLDSLREASENLKLQLEGARKELKCRENEVTNLQAELDRLRQLYEDKLKNAVVGEKEKLSQLEKELERKWTETLRRENMKLRFELTEQQEGDKQSALQQLSKLKEEELSAARTGWQVKVNELLEQITGLKRKAESKEVETSDMMERARKDAAEESRQLREQMLEAADEYSRKIRDMERACDQQIRSLTETKDQECQDLEKELKTKHIEDMQAQVRAHKAMLETVREQLERQRSSDLQEQKQTLKKEIDSMKQEVINKHHLEMEQQGKAHQLQMAAARMELERAIELGKQKENEYRLQLSDLKEEIESRERHVYHLEEELKKLTRGIDDMSKELDNKGKEMLKIRSDCNHQIRNQEESLKQQFKEDLSKLNQDHSIEKQEMLEEFSTAQEMLKDRISAMQIMLEEAEERYRNRESRDEDIEFIQQMQEAVKEREAAMKKLMDDKRYYQLELINRETNFNKIFSAGDPKIGTINPLVKKPKGEKGPTKYFSTSTLSRLQPIPGSPLHDEQLNRSRPLPMVKKFVK